MESQLAFEFSGEKKEETKEEKVFRERQELLNKIGSGNINNLRDRVAFLLNNYNKARNSDLELAWLYWSIFDEDKFNRSYITKDQLYLLTRLNSISRERARIQNEYKLFQADDEVKRYRGVLSKEKKDQAIEDKPLELPMYSIYIDETGKTQQFLSVGSIWVFDGRSTITSNREILEWKEREKIKFEFHFKDVSSSKHLAYYKEFFIRFLRLNPTIAFKAIMIDRKGFSDINKIITDLTFHLIYKGIIHENESGRAPLPRYLQGWLDKEEKGSDQIKIENIKERITSQKIKGLWIGDFFPLESKDNIYIQAVDLFTASINRKLHFPNNEGNVKDELADYILNLLNFDLGKINLKDSNVDSAIVFNLIYSEE